VGETLGVLLASEALALARDAFVRATLTSMIEDEAAHVDLAWRVVRWCIEMGGEPVRAAVSHAIRRGIAATRRTPLRRYDGIDLRVWNEHGRVTCEQARALVERGIREVVEPCARVLLDRGAEPVTPVRPEESRNQATGVTTGARARGHPGEA
jgi:hypothetical protein